MMYSEDKIGGYLKLFNKKLNQNKALYKLNNYDFVNLGDAFCIIIPNIGPNRVNIILDVLLYHFKYTNKPNITNISNLGLYNDVLVTIKTIEDTRAWQAVCKKIGGNNRFQWSIENHQLFNKEFRDTVALLLVNLPLYYGVTGHCNMIIAKYLSETDAFYVFPSVQEFLSLKTTQCTNDYFDNLYKQIPFNPTYSLLQNLI